MRSNFAADDSDKLLQPFRKLRRNTIFLVKDAAHLHALPVCRVDERLKPLIKDVAVTESLLGHLCAALAGSKDSDLSSIEQDLNDMLSQCCNDGDGGDQEKGDLVDEEKMTEKDQASVLLLLVRSIHDRLQHHSAELRVLE